jgi:hypothetical protein
MSGWSPVPATITIPKRFSGPPHAANGGYAAGLIAQHCIGAAAVAVTIRRPLPLDRPLTLEGERDALELRDGDDVLAQAAPEILEERPPRVVSVDEARAASERCAVLIHPDWHPAPTCFVCGTRRERDDGLDLFAGPTGDGLVATTWTPRENAPEIVWAALDCPSSMHIYRGGARPEAMYVLGRIVGRVDERPAIGEELVIVSWELGREGRKLFAACALQRPDGAILATTRATWIRL